MIPSPRKPVQEQHFWVELKDFPGYSVSHDGFVRNDKTGRYMMNIPNQRGMTYVCLTRNKTHINRSVARLVAETFLPEPENDTFDTPINRNGDRMDNHVDNLMWRPRWFAMRFHRQMVMWGTAGRIPLLDPRSGKVFPNVRAVAAEFGLLPVEIHASAMYKGKGEYQCWPTGQHFRFENSHTIPSQKRVI